jgi:hypothetical protein
MEFRNGCMMRKDKAKAGPSGMSQNQAYSLPEAWNRRNCLLKIEDSDLSIIKDLKEELGGDELVSFSTPEFSVHALEAFNSLDLCDLTFKNVWFVFVAMLPLLSN